MNERTCMGCNKKRQKQELLRIVKNKQGEISIDIEGKKPGRGAYICKNINCLEKLQKSKRFQKSFGMGLPDELIEKIGSVLKG